MIGDNRFISRVDCCLSTTVLLVALATGAAAQKHDKDKDKDHGGGRTSRGFLTAPLHIQDQGSFYIGGVPKVTNYAASATPATNGTAANQIMIGQMYVQFQIPEGWSPDQTREGKWPVIMVHGSTHTGACLESTPDGREGWEPYFVRHGFPVYVVDQAGRGRSGFDESMIHEGEARLIAGDVAGGEALIPSFGRITSNGAWTAWFGFLFPGGQTPPTNIMTSGAQLMQHGPNSLNGTPTGDPLCLTRPGACLYPVIFPIGTIDQPAYPNEALASALPYTLGPDLAANGAPVVHGGPAGPSTQAGAGLGSNTVPQPTSYYELNYYKQLVPNGEVTLPSSICPTCDNGSATMDRHIVTPANTWTPFDLALLVEKLGGAVVATHSQSGAMGHHMARFLKERGHLNMLKALVTIEGSCSFAGAGLTAADFDNIAYLALKGDYTARSAVCADSAVGEAATNPGWAVSINGRRAAGMGSAKAEYIQLDSLDASAFDGTTHMMMLGANNLAVASVIEDWVSDALAPQQAHKHDGKHHGKDDDDHGGKDKGHGGKGH